MNPNIQKLYAIAKRDARVIVGLMSGTSLDGLDICLCMIKGFGPATQISIIHHDTLAYSSSFRDEIKSVFAKRDADLAMVSAMHAKIGIAHADLVLNTLNKWKVPPSKVDLIASHGQTIFHAPRSLFDSSEYPNNTLQIGDGDHIAHRTGIITVSDFRQKHVASGGEGAPLVVYGDYLLFASEIENRILLNIGGISNFTYLPAKKNLKGVFASDIGPGNTLMNQYMKLHFNQPFDENGQVARQGKVNKQLLTALLDHPFFDENFPKTTGPELFNLEFLSEAQIKSGVTALSHEDTMATLAQLTVDGIIEALARLPVPSHQLFVYVSGGGWCNPILSAGLKDFLSQGYIESTDVLGVPADAKEAMLFALLANETVAGEQQLQFGPESGAPAVFMGKISFPN